MSNKDKEGKKIKEKKEYLVIKLVGKEATLHIRNLSPKKKQLTNNKNKYKYECE